MNVEQKRNLTEARNSNHERILQMCKTAVCMAIVCLATMLIQIPIPLGYAHLGDSMILLSVFLFGPTVGIVASGVGSAMADVLTGYMIWAVPTLLIKSIMPFIAWLFFRRFNSGDKTQWRVKGTFVLGAVSALLFMVAGYVIFGAILYGSIAAGAASAPGLLLKAIVNFSVFVVAAPIMKRANKSW